METQTLTLKITLHTMETQTPTLEITLLTMETRTRTRATTLHSMEQCWNRLGGARRCLLGLTKNGSIQSTKTFSFLLNNHNKMDVTML